MASILDSLDSAPSEAPRRSGSILDAPDSLSFDVPAPPAGSIKDTRSTTDKIFGRYDPIINEAADRYGLDRRLLKGLVSVESSNNPNAVSNKGALGLGQVMPGTAREMGYSPEDMADPVKNVDASARYLAKMLDMSKGDIATALRKYNAGPYADLTKINNQKYADDVMSRAMRYNESDRSDLARGFEQGIKGFANDVTRGLQGFSNAAEGFDAGQNYLDYLNAQEDISAGARPQDQLSGAEGWGEILGDTVPTTLGQGLGSSAPALAGAGLGFLAGGPVGAVLGGALPLAAQYLGNTWAESTKQDLLDQRIQNAATAPRDQLEQAAGMDTAETLRVGGAGLARAGVELGSDLALGGLGGMFGKGASKLLPSGMGGGALDLLNTPLGKTATGMSTEALTEMADVPLTALGAGRPLTQIPGSEYSDAAFGGAVGGGVMVAGGQAATNLGGVMDQTRGFVDPNYRPDYQSYATGRRALGGDPVSEGQYNREFYNDRFLRERTRNASDYVRQGVEDRVAGIQARQVAQAAQQEQQAVVEQQKPRSEKIREILAQMQADYEAQVAASKPPKVTKEELDTEVAQWVDDEANAGKALPAHLADLKAFQKYRTQIHKADAPAPGKKPTYQDALAQVNQMEAEAKTGPWRRKGDAQLDMYGNQYGNDPSKVRAPEAEAEMPEGDRSKQMEMDLSGGYAGTRLLPQSGAIYASQTPVSPVEEGSGQFDMFGTGYGVDPSKVRPTDVEETDAATAVDPRQGELAYPVNDASSARRYEAAFNRAEREQAAQKARDERQAAQATQAKNRGTIKAQQEIAANDIAAETAPDLSLKKRQVIRLNKAQQAAADAQAEADRLKEGVRQTFVQEANAAIGPDETGNPQIPDNAVLNAGNKLFSSNRGRPGKGMQWSRPVTRKGKVLGYYKVPTEVTDEAAAPEAQPEARDAAPQEGVLTPREQEVAQAWDSIPSHAKSDVGLASLMGQESAMRAERMSGAEAVKAVPMGLWGKVENVAARWANRPGATPTEQPAPRTKTVKLTQRDADQIGGRSRGPKNDPLPSRHQYTGQLVGKTPDEIRSWIDAQTDTEAKRTGVEAHNRLVKRRGDSSGANRLVTQPDGEVMTEAEFVGRLKNAKKVEPQKETPTKAEANATLEDEYREAKQNAEDPNDDYVSYDDLNDFSAGAGMDFDYSKNETNPTQGTRAYALEQVVRDLTGKDSNWKVRVFKTVAEASAALGREIDPKAKAFVTNGKAHFITDNIAPGSELAVFLHEVGAHLGMERILNSEQRTRLANKIKQWAETGKGVEAKAAKAALQRAGDNMNEQIAYFVEEAVKAGVDPTAMDMKSDLGRWFRQLWAAMKTALRRLGVKNLDNLSAQDVVNLAYGAARLELSGNWHGSAKNFNKFSNKYRGTGEGGLEEGSDDFADMIAYGQYFAGKRGTAEGYRDAIAGRASTGGYWDAPVGMQIIANRIDEYGPIVDRATSQGLKPLVNFKPVDAPDWARPLRNWIAWGDGTPLTTKEWRLLNDIDGYLSDALEKGQGDISLADGLVAPKLRDDWKENLKTYQSAINKLRKNRGTLYNVDFNIADDEWLDWDKTLGEQVSGKAAKAWLEFRQQSAQDLIDKGLDFVNIPNSYNYETPAKAMYRSLSTAAGMTEKKASEFLNSRGVKGVRYLDAGSRRRGGGTYNYVVFDPKNVVVGNKNSPRTESDEIQYSIKDYVDDQLKPFGQNSTDWAADAIKTMTTTLRSIPWLAKWKPEMKSLQQLHKADLAMQTAYNQIASQAFAQVDSIKMLPTPAQKTLSKMMLDSTLAGIHPGEDFQKGINAHLGEADQAKYDELKARWDDMVRAEPDTAKIYNNTLKLFQDLSARRQAALEELAKKTMSPREANKVKQALTMAKNRMQGPYFPIGRFGDYVVVWKSKEYQQAQEDNDVATLQKLKSDPKHYRMRMEKTDTAGRRRLKEWQAELGDAFDAGKPEVKPKQEVSDGIDVNLMPLLEKMKESLTLTLDGKVNKKEMQEAKDALARTFIASLPDTNVFLSSLKRENVAGADAMDMLRGIASHGGSQAFYISRLEHNGSIQDALQALYNEDTAAMNAGEKVSIYRAVAKGLQGMYSQDPSTFSTKALAGGMSLFYHARLTVNPAFWATSAMTPALVTVPYLTSRHKTTAAYSAWWRGMQDAAKILKFSSMPEYLRFSFGEQIKKSGLAADEVKMLEALEAAGSIDQSEIRELSSIAKGDLGIGDDAMRFIAGLSHRAEVMSRISTALAAYRLEKARTKDADAATQYALDAVDETLVNYTAAHTPLILRRIGPVGKAMTQFMRYQFGMGQLMSFQINKAMSKTASPEVRKEAQKRLAALMVAHAIGTGGSGLFGMKALSFALQLGLSMFYPDDDEPDLEAKTREMLDQALGKTGSTIARRGLPAAIGLDLSGRMGMGDVLSLRRENPLAGDRQGMAAAAANSIGVVSYALDVVDWMKNPRATKFPVSPIANAAKAYELATVGMTNMHGVVKKGAEDFSGLDILLQAMGFTPTEKTEAFDRQAAERKRKEAIGQGRQQLLDNLYAAMRKGDKERIADLQTEIREFNSRHTGDKKAAITSDTTSKSFRQRQKREAEMNEYGFAP